jgi:hypothetical protein
MRLFLKYSVICYSILLINQGCGQRKHQTADSAIPPKFVETEPKFVHQGNLFFFDAEKKELGTIEIEIAKTDASREKGLMHRKKMDYNQGMLFIFDDERRRNFWMKDTDLALDIVFVNSEKMIIHIAPDCIPYSTETIPSFEYAQYVVEVNAGYCRSKHIEVGGYIEFTQF